MVCIENQRLPHVSIFPKGSPSRGQVIDLYKMIKKALRKEVKTDYSVFRCFRVVLNSTKYRTT